MTENELEKYVYLYRGMVFRLAYSYMKNREDAEDISQDAFLKLYRSNEHFEADENVKAWLMRVTINLSKNMFNASWFRRCTELENDIPYESDREEALMEFVNRLKPEYSVIIHLFYYEGYATKEIAKICRITDGTVRKKET